MGQGTALARGSPKPLCGRVHGPSSSARRASMRDPRRGFRYICLSPARLGAQLAYLRSRSSSHAGGQRQRLQAAGIPIPANLEFVAIDFELVTLHEGMQTTTLNFSEPAIFSCLGVLVYLTRDAVDAVFRFVAAFPASSEIVFIFRRRNRRSPAWLAERTPWANPGEPTSNLRR